MPYLYLPSTSELLDFIELNPKPEASDKWIWITMGMAIAILILVLACIGLRHFKWISTEAFNSMLVFLLVIFILFASIFTVMILRRHRIGGHPAKEIATDIDLEASVKFQLLRKLRQIPSSVLLERHRHIEEHLASRDKWLGVSRWIAAISAALIVLSGNVLEYKSISLWIANIVSLLLIGFAIGAIWVRRGSSDLKHLSFIVKEAGERRQVDDMRRKKRRRG